MFVDLSKSADRFYDSFRDRMRTANAECVVHAVAYGGKVPEGYGRLVSAGIRRNDPNWLAALIRIDRDPWV